MKLFPILIFLLNNFFTCFLFLGFVEFINWNFCILIIYYLNSSFVIVLLHYSKFYVVSVQYHHFFHIKLIFIYFILMLVFFRCLCAILICFQFKRQLLDYFAISNTNCLYLTLNWFLKIGGNSVHWFFKTFANSIHYFTKTNSPWLPMWATRRRCLTMRNHR